MSETVFVKLCTIVDDLQSQVRDLDHSSQKLALEAIVDRLDCLIDDVVGLEIPALEEDHPHA